MKCRNNLLTHTNDLILPVFEFCHPKMVIVVPETSDAQSALNSKEGSKVLKPATPISMIPKSIHQFHDTSGSSALRQGVQLVVSQIPRADKNSA